MPSRAGRREESHGLVPTAQNARFGHSQCLGDARTVLLKARAQGIPGLARLACMYPWQGGGAAVCPADGLAVGRSRDRKPRTRYLSHGEGAVQRRCSLARRVASAGK